MAGALKQAFIEAVRLTPDGIAAFLETPLPEAPIVAADDNTANEALAAFLLDLFRPFAGLTPVELLLRIGQHNNVLESAMIAGLEYIEGADSSEQAVAFTEPVAGQSYAPGEMRFTVTVKNGTPGRVNLTVDDGDPLKMTADEDGKTWVQYQTIVATGAHTAGVSAEFAAGDVQSASVSFSIDEYDPENPPDPPPETPPEPPGGSDPEALTRLKTAVLAAYQQVLSFGNTGDLDEYRSRMASFTAAVTAFTSAVSDTSTAVTQYKARITELISDINQILSQPEILTLDIDNAQIAATRIVNNVEAIYTTVS